MTPQLTRTREADTLVLAGELDQDVLAPLWDARVEAMNGVTRIDLSQISVVDTGGLALLAHLVNQAKSRAMPCRCLALTTRFTRWRNYITCPKTYFPVCNECRMVYPAYTSHDPRRPDKLR